MFPEKLRQSKWKQEKRDLRVGDVVLRKDETAAGQTYKYAKVVKVHTSTDGKVRAADIEYKLPGESVFRTTTRPIHKLVLVVPVEEQISAVDQAEEAPVPVRAEEAGTAEVVSLERGPEAARQEGTEAAGEGGSLTEARPHPPQDREGVAEPTIEPREVIPRRKAGEKAQAIIVAAPKEEAEMVDIGARPKKRGRPRKNPSVDPLDPHKGSVLYP